MRGFWGAVLLSLAVHGVIAAGIAFYFACASAPEELAQLDLARVDLSFAEMRDETSDAATASAPMVQAAPSQAHEPTIEASLSEAMRPAEPMVAQPDTSDLPRPEEATTVISQSAVAPQQAQVDAPPKPRHSIKPEYPKRSRMNGEEGRVTLAIGVSEKGAVDDVRVERSSGFYLLDAAAVKAIRAARFTPAKAKGKSIASETRLTLDFRLK